MTFGRFNYPDISVVLLAVALSSYKLYILGQVSRAQFDCWCLLVSALPHEAQLLFLLVSLHIASLLARWYPLRLFIRLAIIAVLLITFVDLVVIKQFTVRFTLIELLKYSSELPAVFNHVKLNISGGIPILITVILIGLLLAIFRSYLRAEPAPRTIRPALPIALLISALGGVGIGWAQENEYHTRFIENSLAAFIAPATRQKPYTAEFVESLTPPPHHDVERCYLGRGDNQDLILVVLESFSYYHSNYFSGLNDWTPHLDELASQGLALTNFSANGVNSEDGLLALLTGEPPVSVPGTSRTFEQSSPRMTTLPALLDRSGYLTAFLTTGDLEFHRMGDWLTTIGFQYIEGHESAFYDGMKRWHFNAAEDAELYHRALDFLSKEAADRPIFLTLATVSSHHPFIDPDTGIKSEERVIRYADRALGEFVERLRSQDFFDHGYVLITSDHRAMVPIRQDEYALSGDRAYSRIPLVALGKEIRPQKINQAFSQTDLFPSIQYLVGTQKQCLSVNQGIFLPRIVQAPDCVYTRRSYDHDILVAQCGDRDYVIKLDGDDTRYAESYDQPLPLLIDEINRLRVGRGF